MSPEFHPKAGRPRRLDWRLPWGLSQEEPGAILLCHVTFQPERLRAEWLGMGDGGAFRIRRLGGDAESVLWAGSLIRYRVLQGAFLVGDFVVRRGVSEGEWRGVVIQTDGDEVLVDTPQGEDNFFWDELELANARTEPLPQIKPGPYAADFVAEANNQLQSTLRQRAKSHYAGDDPEEADLFPR